MVEFARYYIDFIRSLIANIGEFFRLIFVAFKDFFGSDIIGYFNQFSTFSLNFEFLDWLIAIVVILINTTFIVFLVIRLYQLLRKYVRFVGREVEKEYLLEEIALLSQKAVELTNEKNKILQLKMESFGMNPELFEKKETKTVEKKKVESRFTKLT